ncbi:hypothetical protein niasHT_028252 [Heterodera trifolii]|uniref:Uncharacterized protein n=1 Tax=Heterodera trifolii TaxID=157864 RepID=A0ABD2JUT3_9BILA
MVEPRHRSPAFVIAGTPQPGKFRKQQPVQLTGLWKKKGEMGWKGVKRWRELWKEKGTLSPNSPVSFSNECCTISFPCSSGNWLKCLHSFALRLFSFPPKRKMQ